MVVIESPTRWDVYTLLSPSLGVDVHASQHSTILRQHLRIIYDDFESTSDEVVELKSIMTEFHRSLQALLG